MTPFRIFGGPLLRAGVGSTVSLSTRRTGLDTTTAAGGVSIQEAMVEDCNRYSGVLEDALMMERDSATHRLTFPNDNTDEDPSNWSLDVVVASVQDRGTGCLRGSGRGWPAYQCTPRDRGEDVHSLQSNLQKAKTAGW